MTATHPTCPECGRRLVFVALARPGVLLKAWMCDCAYRGEDARYAPPGLVADIVRSREWDDGSIAIDMTKLGVT